MALELFIWARQTNTFLALTNNEVLFSFWIHIENNALCVRKNISRCISSLKTLDWSIENSNLSRFTFWKIISLKKMHRQLVSYRWSWSFGAYIYLLWPCQQVLRTSFLSKLSKVLDEARKRLNVEWSSRFLLFESQNGVKVWINLLSLSAKTLVKNIYVTNNINTICIFYRI